MGVNDDWSYIQSALHLAQTGHIAYNGWSGPILGWQLYLGALFIKVFGFSFSAARFSILLLAAVAVYLLHRILLLCGVKEPNATVGTLTFSLSPLFLPLTFSFMSDIAGVFSLILCLYLCLRALHANTKAAARNWLIFAVVSNVITGSARQISWLGVLVWVPVTFWLLGNRRPSLIKSAVLWVAGIFGIFLCVSWYQHQPYSLQETLTAVSTHQSKIITIANIFRVSLDIPMLLLPVLIAFITPTWVRTARQRFVAWAAIGTLCGLTLLGLVVYSHHLSMNWLAPFGQNYVTSKGTLDLPAIGSRPDVLNLPVRAAITLLTVAGLFAFLACCFSAPAIAKTTAVPPSDRPLSNRDLLILLGPFTLIYFGLLLPRAFADLMYDRYLSPLLVVALIACLLIYQEKVAARLPAFSSVILIVVACFSVASMHDFFASERARLEAANQLLASGLKRTDFYGGFEYDGWTQVDSWGYVMTGQLRTPERLHHRQTWTSATMPCGYIYANVFIAIQPQYAVSYDSKACQGPSRFSPVVYRTWLPPWTNSLYIQTVVASPSSPPHTGG
jgi:hypothetical protein